MGNLTLGLRVLFRIWSDGDFALQVRNLEQGKLAPRSRLELKPEPQTMGATPPVRVVAPAAPPPRRSEAVSLLAMLQREARFVDFIKEPISTYSNEQIGAAVRDVHQGCATVLERAFALQPLASMSEGAPLEVPRGFDPAQFRLLGQVTGEPPFRGTLQHHGWKATRCELPQWTGSDGSALVVAPAEVEIQ